MKAAFIKEEVFQLAVDQMSFVFLVCYHKNVNVYIQLTMGYAAGCNTSLES